MNAEPPEGPVPSRVNDGAYMPFAQLAANVDCALLTARSEPMAEASLPEMRARSRPGTAIAAMMPMIATTISSSMSVKPFSFLMSSSPGQMRYQTRVDTPRRLGKVSTRRTASIVGPNLLKTEGKTCRRGYARVRGAGGFVGPATDLNYGNYFRLYFFM